MFSSLSRPRALALCALPVVALFAVVGLAPLPYAIAQPGTTADVLGEDKGREVITITGAPVRPTKGELRMTTIIATGPSTDVDLADVTDAWFRTDRAVLPHDSVYPSGKSDAEIEKHNLGQMKESQDAATLAALGYLEEGPREGEGDPAPRRRRRAQRRTALLPRHRRQARRRRGRRRTHRRPDRRRDGHDPAGRYGRRGRRGLLKTQAAARDGATVFLVPKDECSDALAEQPKGLWLVPVTALSDAVASLRALEQGQESKVPSC